MAAVAMGTALAAPVAEAASDDGAVLVGAGDIAGCAWPGDEATADLLDRLPGTVFTAGDNPSGRFREQHGATPCRGGRVALAVGAPSEYKLRGHTHPEGGGVL